MDLSWWSTSYSISYDLSVDQMVAWAEAMELRVLSLMRIQISEY